MKVTLFVDDVTSMLPGELGILYPVISEPPSPGRVLAASGGTSQDINARPFPDSTVTFTGGRGTVRDDPASEGSNKTTNQRAIIGRPIRSSLFMQIPFPIDAPPNFNSYWVRK